MPDEPQKPADLPLMFTFWIRNDVTKEATQIKGQGKNVPDAFKEGWENANEAFGKGSSGEYISLPRLGVKLPSGETVLRSPSAFASREPYNPETENKAAPVCTGEAARKYEGPWKSYKGGKPA